MRQIAIYAAESGALSKAFGTARVVPFLLGMAPGDVKAPLGQFEGVTADREGSIKLVEELNTYVLINSYYKKYYDEHLIIKSELSKRYTRNDAE